MSVLGLCLALAATPANQVFVPGERFTLAWVHSIERVRWEEDYAAFGTPPRLLALAARVRGSGAGMEPPPDAVLRRGWFEYRPADRLPARLPLSRSGFTADYELCTAGVCRPMAHWLPSDGGVTNMTACSRPAARRATEPGISPG